MNSIQSFQSSYLIYKKYEVNWFPPMAGNYQEFIACDYINSFHSQYEICKKKLGQQVPSNGGLLKGMHCRDFHCEFSKFVCNL